MKTTNFHHYFFMPIELIILLFVTGILGGFLAGLTGVGGNMIFIPVLDFVLQQMGLNVDKEWLVKAIIANSLCITVCTGSLVSFRQYKMGNYFPKEILLTAFLGIITSLSMSYFIKTGNWYSKETFNYVFICMLIPFIIKLLSDINKENKQALQLDLTNISTEKTTENPQNNLPKNAIKDRSFLITGAFVGMITALSGLGGGILMIPMFTDILKMPIKKASAISSGVIPLLSFPICMMYLFFSGIPSKNAFQIGYVDIRLILPIVLGAVFSTQWGVKAAQKTSPKVIRMVFASLVIVIFVKMAYEISR